MADIAMLVAEEYERRLKMKNSCCSTKAHEEQERELEGVLKLINMGLVSDYVKGKIGEEKVRERMEAARKWVSKLDPRSPIGIAASHGFFSA